MVREKRWRRLRKRGFVDSDGGTRGMSTKAVVSTKNVLWVEMEVMAAVRGWTWKGNEKGKWKGKREKEKGNGKWKWKWKVKVVGRMDILYGYVWFG